MREGSVASGPRNRYKQSGPGDVSGHKSLGEAILRFLDEKAGIPPEPRTTKRQLTYVLSKRTGVSADTAVRQLGITLGTLKRWLRGKQNPSAGNQKRIADLYERFWGINHDVRNPKKRPAFKTARLVIENKTNADGIIIQEGRRNRIVNPLEIDAARNREWKDVLSASTPEEAFTAFKKGVLGKSPWPSVPEYMDFLQGYYAIWVA